MSQVSREEWPRSAVVVLPLFAMAATVVALVLARPPAVLLAAAGGLLAAGGAVAFVRRHRERGTFTAVLVMGVFATSLIVSAVLAVLALYADGTLQRAAGATLAGAVAGMTGGSWLWLLSVRRNSPGL